MAAVCCLLLFVLFPPEDCDALFDRSSRLLEQVVHEEPKAASGRLRRLVASAEAARACYGAQQPERVMRLYAMETYALFALNRYQEVIERADAFLDAFAGRAPADRRSYIYRRRGIANLSLGRFTEAVNDLTEAARHADASPEAAAYLHLQLGVAYQRMNDFHMALHHFREVEALLRKAPAALDEPSDLLAMALRYQADLLLQQADMTGQYAADSLAQAAVLAKRAASIYRGLNALSDLGIALIKQAEAHAYAGRPQEGFPYLEEALRLAAQVNDADLHLKAVYKLGRLEMQTEAHAAARRHLEEALALARAQRNLDYQRRITTDLGLLSEMRANWEQAERWYRQSTGLTEAYRASLGTTAWASIAFSYWREPYRGLVRVLLRQDRPEEAFRELDRTHARHLRDLRQQAVSSPALSRVDSLRADSLAHALAEVRNLRAWPTLNDSAHAVLEAEEARLMARLSLIRAPEPAADTLSLARVQQALRARSRVLIAYFIDRPAGPFARPLTSYAFVVTPSELHAVPLPATAEAVHDLLAQVNPLLAAARQAVSINALQFDLKALHGLYELLFAPIAPRIPEGTPLVFIPDDVLFLLPFGLLVEAETARFDYRGAPFLLKKHPLSVEASASLITAPAPPEDRTLDVVAFGKTRFAAEAERGAGRAAPLFDLPAVEEELQAIGKLFRHARILLDEAATEAAFFRHMHEPNVLHLASHADIHPSMPLHNAIYLSYDAATPDRDGVLYLHELQHQRLSTPLVVLSGCNTARGALRGGEGLQGLQFAFRSIGVPSLLSTHWLMADEASVPLMEHFYRQLREGRPKDVALQQAQLAFLARADENLTSPFYWGAPVLYGDMAPLPLRARAAFSGPVFTGMLCALLLLLLIFSRVFHVKRPIYS